MTDTCIHTLTHIYTYNEELHHALGSVLKRQHLEMHTRTQRHWCVLRKSSCWFLEGNTSEEPGVSYTEMGAINLPPQGCIWIPLQKSSFSHFESQATCLYWVCCDWCQWVKWLRVRWKGSLMVGDLQIIYPTVLLPSVVHSLVALYSSMFLGNIVVGFVSPLSK